MFNTSVDRGQSYTTSSTYDSLGRVLTTALPDPDGAGALAAETLTTTYNARGLAETVYGIDTYVSDFDYEANGALDKQTLGSGVIINNTYDPLTNRLTSLFAARPAYLALLDFDYTYDDGGNITVIEDEVRDEAWSYEYDALDRLTYAGLSDGNGLLLERQSFTYDTLGNILTTSTQLPAASASYGAFMVAGAGGSANYGSRAALNSLTGHGLASENYETSSVKTSVTGLPSGGSSPGGPGYTRGSFASGAQGESASYQGAAGFNPLSGMGVGDETAGMGITAFVRGMVEGFGGYQPPEPYTGPTGAEQQTYTYAEDGAGPHAVTSLSDGSTFTYDANGNMATRYQEGVNWTYTFDDENRLAAVSDGTTTTTYLYDHSGTRVKRVVDDGTTVTETIYVMGMEITRVDDTETERTIYYGAGGAFRVIEAGDTSYTQTDLYYRLSDHLGSTTLITDEDGLKVEGSEALYGPFGELRQAPTTSLTDFGYTGQRLDGSTGGLMYYGARYYLPELRRFISADTIVPSAYDSQALNRYAYVVNNPVKLVDPSGHLIQMPLLDGIYGSGYVKSHKEELPYAPGPLAATSEAAEAASSYANDVLLNNNDDDLERLASLSDFVGGGMGSEQSGYYAEVMTQVILGVPSGPFAPLMSILGDGCNAWGLHEDDCVENEENGTYLRSTGFHDDFQDGNGTHNQVYHFWASVGAIAGSSTDFSHNVNTAIAFVGLQGIHELFQGTVGNILHDFTGGDPIGEGASWQDYALTMTGIEFANQIWSGNLTPNQAGDWMRENLSAPYSGISPVIMQFLYPLPGYYGE